jgi:hypothetical protein
MPYYDPYVEPRKPIKRWTKMDEAILRAKQREYDSLANNMMYARRGKNKNVSNKTGKLRKDIDYYRSAKRRCKKSKQKHNRSPWEAEEISTEEAMRINSRYARRKKKDPVNQKQKEEVKALKKAGKELDKIEKKAKKKAWKK